MTKAEANLMAAALEEARTTNKKLNRRLQAYEAGLAEKIEKAHAKYSNLGRALANAAAIMNQRKYEEAKVLLDQAQNARKQYALCLACGSLVEVSGVSCLVGLCEKCGFALYESEIEVVDPVKLFAERSK